ncbi:aspartate/glutamate racemase family protein [Flindersiella endophytica]
MSGRLSGRMRTIGLLGGMSWESSALYYKLVNEAVRDRLGGTHSASSVMLSFDFAEIEALQERGAWAEAGALLSAAALDVQRAGADVIVLCTNTMHRLADEIAAAIDVPLLHIADATAAVLRADGHQAVGLLGTRYTMEADFYRGRLEQEHGLNVLVPPRADRDLVHEVIYDELVRGIVREESRQAYDRVIAGLFTAGATAVILGCTEIELLVPPGTDDRLYPTTAIHARAAVDFALSGE